MIKNKKELETTGVELARIREQKNILVKQDTERAEEIKEYMSSHDLGDFETDAISLKLVSATNYEISIERALKVVTFQDLKNANAITIDKKKFEALLTVKNKENQLQACREEVGSSVRLNVKLGIKV